MESGQGGAKVNKEAVAVVWVRDDEGLDQGGGSGDGEEMGAEMF